MAHWQNVTSTAISKVKYDAAVSKLYIIFHDDATAYEYCRVPESIYRGLINASSKGRYFDQHIKGQFQC